MIINNQFKRYVYILLAPATLMGNTITIHNQTKWFGNQDGYLRIICKMKDKSGSERWIQGSWIKTGEAKNFKWHIEKLKGSIFAEKEVLPGYHLHSFFIQFCSKSQEPTVLVGACANPPEKESCLAISNLEGKRLGQMGGTEVRCNWPIVASWRSNLDPEVKNKKQAEDGDITVQSHFFVCGRESAENPAKARRASDSNWSHDGYIYQGRSETFTCPTD